MVPSNGASSGPSSSCGSLAGQSSDSATQMHTFRQYVSMLTDPTYKDESKLKAAQALSEDLEASSYYFPSALRR